MSTSLASGTSPSDEREESEVEDGDCRGLSIGETEEEGTEEAGSESTVLIRWRATLGGRAVVDMAEVVGKDKVGGWRCGKHRTVDRGVRPSDQCRRSFGGGTIASELSWWKTTQDVRAKCWVLGNSVQDSPNQVVDRHAASLGARNDVNSSKSSWSRGIGVQGRRGWFAQRKREEVGG